MPEGSLYTPLEWTAESHKNLPLEFEHPLAYQRPAVDGLNITRANTDLESLDQLNHNDPDKETTKKVVLSAINAGFGYSQGGHLLALGFVKHFKKQTPLSYLAAAENQIKTTLCRDPLWSPLKQMDALEAIQVAPPARLRDFVKKMDENGVRGRNIDKYYT
jgi:hypothetical protein